MGIDFKVPAQSGSAFMRSSRRSECFATHRQGIGGRYKWIGVDLENPSTSGSLFLTAASEITLALLGLLNSDASPQADVPKVGYGGLADLRFPATRYVPQEGQPRHQHHDENEKSPQLHGSEGSRWCTEKQLP